jgi:hypothetical protein
MRVIEETLRPKRKLLLCGLVVALVSFACGGMRMPDPESHEARLYSKKCSICHGLPHPSRHSRIEWEHYLELMKINMDKKSVPYSAEEIRNIRNYLHRFAKGATS